MVFPAEAAVLFRLLHHLLDLFMPLVTAEKSIKFAFVRFAMMRASVVLPTPGGPPEDHGAHVVALDEAAQNLAFAQQVLLTAVFVQRLRADARRQRLALFSIKKGRLFVHGFAPENGLPCAAIERGTGRHYYSTSAADFKRQRGIFNGKYGQPQAQVREFSGKYCNLLFLML